MYPYDSELTANNLGILWGYRARHLCYFAIQRRHIQTRQSNTSRDILGYVRYNKEFAPVYQEMVRLLQAVASACMAMRQGRTQASTPLRKAQYHRS